MEHTANKILSQLLPDTVSQLPKHDLVFGSPINDPVAGIPLGDGDTGSLVWFEADAIHININKTDLWDDSTLESDCICSGETENLTCLRHGGELVIRFGSPCFDMIYQKNFEARLALADATLQLDAETPFSHIQAKCFAFNKRHTTALRCRYSFAESDTPQISLLRWGSRNYWRWYNVDKAVPEAGLGGTATQVQDGRIYITQHLNGTDFCLGLAVVSDIPHTEATANRHTGRSTFAESTTGEFTLYWNISLGETSESAQKNTAAALDAALSEGFDAMHRRHAAQLTDFWNTSYVSIPHDYLENCYYLSLYYSNSECRGAYPPLFTNGIWGFRHDFSPWAYYFHYNMQHMYGPLEPSGHGALAENYYRMRRAGLDAAYRFAQKIKGKAGSFYHDVTDRYGRGAEYDSHNCTPGAQLGMAMYRHWRMNGDDAFLHSIALPVMKGAAEFYLGILQKEKDGLYHIHGTTAYEGTPLFHDTITDLVMIRALFGALKNHCTDAERTVYEDVLTHLPGYITVPLEEDEVQDGVLLCGIGKGRPVHGAGHVLTVGLDDDGKPVRKNHGDPAKEVYGFPDTEMSPLYPAGIFGLKDKNTPLFDAMTNQILLHHQPEDCMYWCLMPLYLARMGMAEELTAHLEKMVGTWLIYPNGLGAERTPYGLEELRRLFYNTVLDPDTGVSEKNEAYGFRHFDMETLPIAAHAVCESLLQSYDGVLRICPAVKKEDAVAFCLYAEGGFRVCCRADAGHFSLVVESLRGETCRICLPEHLSLETLTVQVAETADAPLRKTAPVWETVGDEQYLSLPALPAGGTAVITAGAPEESTVFTPAAPNTAWKTCGSVHLGTPPLTGKTKENK